MSLAQPQPVDKAPSRHASRMVTDPRPASVIPASDGLIGLTSLAVAWLAVLALRPPTLIATSIVLLATILPMLWRELRRAPAHPGARQGSGRPLAWLAAFVVATAPFALIHGQYAGLFLWLIAWLTVAPAFIIRLLLEARRNGQLVGGFPAELGDALIPPDQGRLGGLAASARLWGLKAFFVPLYATSLYALLSLALANPLDGPMAWLGLAVTFAYTVDLGFGLSGYLMASNSLVPTIRSTQTRLSGWLVCLACYGPVMTHWPDFQAVVQLEVRWPTALTTDPLVLVGATAMLGLLALYVSATVCFGLRFCNLSNRGLISHGPYRYMKHPAYFAHIANAWIITFIFMPAAGITLDWSQLAVPVAFTLLYWRRAVTEEQHLREDPDYRVYADWIDRNGIVARLRQMTGWRPMTA